jgi:hypothetical protein
VQDHALDHAESKLGRRLVGLVPARQRHHQRRNNEMQRVVEAEDQRHRHDSLLAEGQQRQARPHIADIAVGGRQALDRAFGDIAARAHHRDDEHQRETV